jgi:uncharacterized damage-inducible protein DinB
MVNDFLLEYDRYRALGERAIAQVSDAALNRVPSPDGNSIGMIVRHVSGNLASRFTDFLTSDGEKPWRDRETEFAERSFTRVEVERMWADGFEVVRKTLDGLTDADLSRKVAIRGQPLTVHAALCRSIAHMASHVGQIVLLARELADRPWQSLSIPRGGSAAYNAAPTRERGLR